EGMKVDVAMLDSQVALTENALVRYFATGVVPGPLGARHPSIAPFDAFATADRPIVIAVGGDAAFARLCETIGRPELATDPRFATNAARLANEPALKAALTATLVTRPGAQWIETLRAAGLACGPINTVADVAADPQVAARNMIVEVDDPGAGRTHVFGCPVNLSAFADPPARAPAPQLDADR